MKKTRPRKAIGSSKRSRTLDGPVPAPHGEAKTAGEGRTILVVEDHVDTRRVLSHTLGRKGFGVTTAGSVSAAYEQFLARRPDLVLCDIGLPDGTGWELMKKLRHLGNVKAIAMSGFGLERDKMKSHEAGFMTHLTKPLDLSRLEKLITDSLGPKPRNDAVPSSAPGSPDQDRESPEASRRARQREGYSDTSNSVPKTSQVQRADTFLGSDPVAILHELYEIYPRERHEVLAQAMCRARKSIAPHEGFDEIQREVGRLLGLRS